MVRFRHAFVPAFLLLAAALGAGPATGAEGDACHRYDMEVLCTVSRPTVLVGDPFSATATVRNTGDQVLANVTFVLRGGKGVQVLSQEPLQLTIEKLQPGETREISGTFVSDGVGERRITGHAREEQNWAAAGCHCGVVIKGLPALQIEMIDQNEDRSDGGVWEQGQQFLYRLTVENDKGTAITPDMKVLWTLPPELEFVSGVGDQGVTVTGAGQTAESSAFPLAPDQKQNFEILVKVNSVPERIPLVQTRASVMTVAGGTELATETESTTLRNKVGR